MELPKSPRNFRADRENSRVDSIVGAIDPIIMVSDEFGPTMMIQDLDPRRDSAVPTASISSSTLGTGKDDVPPNCPFVRTFNCPKHVESGERNYGKYANCSPG